MFWRKEDIVMEYYIACIWQRFNVVLCIKRHMCRKLSVNFLPLQCWKSSNIRVNIYDIKHFSRFTCMVSILNVEWPFVTGTHFLRPGQFGWRVLRLCILCDAIDRLELYELCPLEVVQSEEPDLHRTSCKELHVKNHQPLNVIHS